MAHNVLVVSYTFPPTGGAGVQRVSKFVKYLREFDWEPVVLTALNPSVPLKDLSLLTDIPDGVVIHTSKTLEPSYETKQSLKVGSSKSAKSCIKELIKEVVKGLLLPDVQILWWPGLTKSLKAILGSGTISCIFVTSPPYSVLIPTVYYAKKYGVPVVIDFRDEWSFSRDQWENAPKNHLARFIDTYFEGYVLRNCTKFTAATQSYVDSILQRHPHLGRQKGYAITNGYDDEDILDTRASIPPNNKIEFIYTGTVWNATSLRSFMNALDRIVSEKPELLEQITVKIIGRVVDSELDYFCGTAGSCVTLVGYIEHTEVIKEMAKADVLILSLSDLPGAERIIPGKAFEYLATGKHIFAIVPEGETKRLVQETYSNASITSVCSTDEVYDKLSIIIDNIESIRMHKCCSVSEFSRRNLTNKLSEIMLKAIAA